MTGTQSHSTVVGLIAAWALDACSPAERDLVEAHLGGCPACAREAGELREAAADLGGAYLRPPPGRLAGLRAAAAGRRPPATAVPGYAAPYAAQVAALDLLLSGLEPRDWPRIAAYGELSVRDLVVHLAASDGLVAAGLGLTVRPPAVPGETLAARTAAVLHAERGWPVDRVRQSWRAQADALCHALVGQAAPGTVTVTLDRPVPLVDALTARAFETWIHGEDIAAAAGRRPLPPLPEHLHPMADLAARILPHVLFRHVPPPHDRSVRLHLTGDGGGSWTVPLRATVPGRGRPAAVISVDVVEFCRLAGDRRDPARVPVEVRGDTAVARQFLAAVPAMAVVP
ncbi:maleylpyruvate isomerase family mycothiol-dependent enzyme [Jidongwangia harbinensis]|uniref:maleylpyruvate isomerase family mycothiol-dependent enzyme n=1 Tax=Jidongwangia harbinensis TaxID=2878561 RepID=UPI001CD9BABF|nr:maleylpyruvate isomerase family mycothiol-dependent enzyme [Jidongwangia harbinensis]MCA2211277.1 maleylpyruvate isomerase family mycothiol-dependent enzyme [Jidongwangia harbinensis]